MSRARNLADLLDSNGDVVSGALDNVAGLPDAIDVNASAPADSVVIDSSGNVLVGTANIYPADNNVTGHSLTAVGQLQSSVSGYAAFIGNRKSSDGDIATFKKDGTTVGSIGVTSSGTAYNTTSDARLKDNIETITDGTAKMMEMNPVTHTWKADPEAPAVHGFIAQEMQKVIPEAVSGEDGGDEMMSMDYGRITPVIVAALQDAHREIKALKSRIEELEAK
jgi:hypothetical protein